MKVGMYVVAARFLARLAFFGTRFGYTVDKRSILTNLSYSRSLPGIVEQNMNPNQRCVKLGAARHLRNDAAEAEHSSAAEHDLGCIIPAFQHKSLVWNQNGH
jgi:hypothetical protein